MTTLTAIALGLAIGLTLGVLGGGGSILAVPALVYLLHESAQDATTASLVIVGISSAISALSYNRDRQVRWVPGVLFALAGVAASFGGTLLNRSVQEHVLLASFAALMALSALGMLVKSFRSPKQKRPIESPVPASAPSTVGASSILTKVCRYEDGNPGRQVHPANRSCIRTFTAILVAGLIVGFLTGFLGVGGGFIVVPALVMILGYNMPMAVGTSLLIIAINSGVSLTARFGYNHFDWSVIIPFTLAAVLASVLGKRVANRLPASALTRAFAALLLIVAVAMSVETALATS